MQAVTIDFQWKFEDFCRAATNGRFEGSARNCARARAKGSEIKKRRERGLEEKKRIRERAYRSSEIAQQNWKIVLYLGARRERVYVDKYLYRVDGFVYK